MKEPVGYTYEERAAQAEALGISYGKLMALIADGASLPKQVKPIKWPAKSKHRHETEVIIGPQKAAPPKQEAVELGVVMHRGIRRPQNKQDYADCAGCGAVKLRMEMYAIVNEAPGRGAIQHSRYLCRECFHREQGEIIEKQVQVKNYSLVGRCHYCHLEHQKRTMFKCLVKAPGDRRITTAHFICVKCFAKK